MACGYIHVHAVVYKIMHFIFIRNGDDFDGGAAKSKR